MKRRYFLERATAVVALCVIGANGKAFADGIPKTDIVEFSHGVHFARQSDGTWNIWVRAAVLGKKPSHELPIKLEIATDEFFSEIIDSWQFESLWKNSFIVRTSYSPKKNDRDLYFRFIVLQTAGVTRAGKNGEKEIISPIGKLAATD
ncbi:hypothetical protein ACLB1G_15745 [Oxalobacteraceae bacterium A2-2]